jgi:hypothetical protein
MHLILLKMAATAPTVQEGSQKPQGWGWGELRIVCGAENPLRDNDEFKVITLHRNPLF